VTNDPRDPHKETDDVSGAARAVADGGAAGHEAPPLEATPSEPEPPPRAPPPGDVAELAAACVRFVAARYGVELDFAPDTLSFVDQWVRDARAEAAGRPEVAPLVQAAAGAYLGEVIRRAFGGEWVVGADHAEWRLCLSTVYCAFNPIGAVREALLCEPAEGWGAHLELDPGERDGVEQRLASLPAVDPDDYYAPSTRFDVISIVVDALRGGLRARGLGDVRFTPDDYR